MLKFATASILLFATSLAFGQPPCGPGGCAPLAAPQYAAPQLLASKYAQQADKSEAPAVEQIPDPTGGKLVGAAAAKISVYCPAGCTLWVNGKQEAKKFGLRTFSTPPLQAGKTFSYDLTIQDAQGQVARTTVHVQAGKSVTAKF